MPTHLKEFVFKSLKRRIGVVGDGAQLDLQ
jgi:hypothetical protein